MAQPAFVCVELSDGLSLPHPEQPFLTYIFCPLELFSDFILLGETIFLSFRTQNFILSHNDLHVVVMALSTLTRFLNSGKRSCLFYFYPFSPFLKLSHIVYYLSINIVLPSLY